MTRQFASRAAYETEGQRYPLLRWTSPRIAKSS
jgi:hypothetical protein